ncbi:hypothetical protein NLU13_0497 [Sarocladium strictum]|uniref:Uncharacterized protein n=1 Tax=Sarocladium strictum TaxID=5046 RepID=A0AA39LBH5_SARSR|nr:hypothetical protein NLU13_0497 [Sarocladium strictum]
MGHGKNKTIARLTASGPSSSSSSRSIQGSDLLPEHYRLALGASRNAAPCEGPCCYIGVYQLPVSEASLHLKPMERGLPTDDPPGAMHSAYSGLPKPLLLVYRLAPHDVSLHTSNLLNRLEAASYNGRRLMKLYTWLRAY